MKAGLLELADIFVVNKSDLPGADAMASELARVLNMSAPVQSGWSTPVLLTRHDAPDSIERLSSSIEAHRAFVGEQALAVQIRAQRARYRLRSLLARMTDAVVDGFTAEQLARPIGDQVERAANEIRTQLALQTCPPSGAAPD